MLRVHKYLISICLALLAIPLFSCERAEKPESRTLVFEVQSQDSLSTNGSDYSVDGATYTLYCTEEAFINTPSWQAEDSIYQPKTLYVTIHLLGELISSLKNPNGYQVQTQFELEGGVIQVEHSNQAMQVESISGDTLYAVRGEGIVSSGEGSFENISGFFHEESTYRIMPAIGLQQARIRQISCHYELVIDF